MPTFDTYPAGSPCWIDMMSPDVDASTAFYTGLFGWDAQDRFDDDGNRIYTELSRDGHNVAGLGGQMGEMQGAPAVWNTYIATSDVDVTSKAVEAAGGTVMMPAMDVMSAGRMAIYADPTGAVFSVWQPDEHTGAQVANEPNTWSWNELVTRDLGTALEFYTEVFGWNYDATDMPNGTYHVVEGGEHGGLAGAMDMPEGMPEQVPAHWLVYFAVADVEAARAQAEQLGGHITFGPMKAPGVGTIVNVLDPQGAAFAMMQPESMGS